MNNKNKTLKLKLLCALGHCEHVAVIITAHCGNLVLHLTTMTKQLWDKLKGP